jgi:Iap family predicted aminopeptidase
MKYPTFIIAILFVFSLTSFYERDKLARVFEEINANVEQKGRAYETLGEATSTIGHRLTGSPNGKLSEEYVRKLLISYGYKNAQFDPFEVEAWSRSSVSLSLVPDNSDNFHELEVVALAHSPVSAHVKAKIVDCGDGLGSDFEKVKEEIQGKIALFNINVQLPNNAGKSNLHRSEKTALAIQYGAKGVIIANAVKGGVLLTGTASVTGELIPIPAVCVSVEEGIAIREWIADEENILAIIDMQNFSRPIRARNVVATHAGRSRELKHEKIIIGAHLDSWDLATGAMDNGIGAFSVIDIARVFKSLNLKTERTVEFVLFMGEEQGLLGSKHLVERYKESGSLENVKLMMNLDMVNNAQGFNAYGRDELKMFVDEVGEKIKETDAKYGSRNSNRAGLHSDHQSFMMQGVPVISPSGSFPIKAYNCYHANCDNFDLINREEINNNVRYTAMMIYALANAKELPVHKFNENELKDFLIKQELKPSLILGKEWRWGD